MKDDTLKDFPSWEKQRMHEFQTHLGIVRVVVEYNSAYGDLITAFEINGTCTSPVRCKYTGKLLNFHCSGSLCGERSFEKGSIIYEFLLKPLGIDIEGYPAICKDGWDVLYSHYYTFKERLEKFSLKR